MLMEQVKQIRKKVNIPIILMGYINPVLQYGIEKFANDAAAAGVDGVILPDMPMDEYLEHYKTFLICKPQQHLPDFADDFGRPYTKN